MKLLDRFLYPRTTAAIERCDQAITAVGALLDQIERLEIAQDLDAGDAYLDPRYPAPADRLPVPCWVRIGDDWERFAGLDEQNRLVIYREGCAAASYYEQADGERFAWSDWISG